MGVAILMIVCCHIQGVDPEMKIWRIFYPGYLGVDIFLFLSGFGLCYSYNKNDTKTFYRHRFSRIMPLYILIGIFTCLIHIFYQHESLSLWDWVCTLTTLSFWRAGGVFIEWYLSTLIVLYLLFPLFYRMIGIRYSAYGLGAYILANLALIACCDLSWEYECALSRLPMFLLGILYYKRQDKSILIKFLPVYTIGLIAAAILWRLGKVETYIVGYMCAPWIMLVIYILTKYVFERWQRFMRCFEYVGRYTLEIYVANYLILNLVPIIPLKISPSLIYVSLHVILIPLLILINKVAQSAIKQGHTLLTSSSTNKTD